MDRIEQLTQAGVRRRAEQLYSQFDSLRQLRREMRREMLAESRKHPANELLRQIPRLGPIRVALLIALIQTPHRFRTKRQLWAYCGLGLHTRASGEYSFREGQPRHSKRAAAPRGLDVNHNHDLKNLFKCCHACRPLRRCTRRLLSGIADKRHEASNGSPDARPQDCGDYPEDLEERRTLQSGTFETASSFSVTRADNQPQGDSAGRRRFSKRSVRGQVSNRLVGTTAAISR